MTKGTPLQSSYKGDAGERRSEGCTGVFVGLSNNDWILANKAQPPPQQSSPPHSLRVPCRSAR